MLKEINTILDTNLSPSRHSFFQLQHFVLNKEPTIQARLHTCIRELKSKQAMLVNIERECEDIQDKIELTMLEVEKLKEDVPDDDPFELKKYEILMRQLNRRINANKDRMKELEKSYNSVCEESQFFIEAFKQLSAQEALKPWDDLEVQKQYWDAKIGNELRMRLILGMPVGEELANMALSLPAGAVARNQMETLITEVKKELGALPTAEIDL